MQKQTNSYGQLLPDQVDRISSLFDGHLGLLADARELYRERAALERDYATKLKQLAKKASEKKNKNELLLVLGDDKAVYTESVIQQNTLNHAYSEILSSMSSSAQDHINLAEAWSQMTESLKAVERRNDDYKKKYDADCAEVEIHRQKQSGHDRHAERSARQYDLQRLDMLNSKNIYIISTATANSVKTKFYTEDLPSLEDTRLVMDFVGVMREAQNIQLSHQNILKDRLTAVIAALIEVQPDKDQALFAEYNIRPFSLPNDWVFEPCSNHYDTGDICIDSGPKVLLQNKLARSRAKLRELNHVLGKKRTDAEKYHDDAMNSYLDTAHEVTALSTSACVLNSEINMIAEVLGGDEGGSSPHVFKSSAFSIPTTCGYCKVSIWGLSKQGKTCKSCGLSVHSKCELNVISFSHLNHVGMPLTDIVRYLRSASAASVSTSSRKTPIPSSSVPHNTSLHVEETHRLARAIFDFAASSSFELNVTEGTVVRVVEEDDGSGWVKVADSDGEKGLVPATYLEDAGGWPLEKSEPSQRDSQQASGIYVRALYDYRAQEPGELTINEGDLVELSSGTNGGQNYADGWWEGFSRDGKKGIFPSNYLTID
ncbi:uncharacterized protein F5891DRAFT_1044725 [Suillus fuscotomentosus]|uniref:Uncharacterized protein n=1 Tax=Suillus fuscotomentosus TaxID=1912939 RepID=A0AAD4E1S7_9AGAM|nr:uncharacterized protein F5891DRAFT_1044725 [Suillus fuscotomentosus]KAG1898149.1 hypothetical protein F5891DRAFT_1044725 [Suillus fuscotomentosus]